jgi:hypothetical protein
MRKYLLIGALLLVLVGLSASSASAQEWTVVTLGGDAVCARGTPYSIFVRNGDPAKLLILERRHLRAQFRLV